MASTSSRIDSRIAAAATTAIALCGCGRLDEISYTPLTTPEQWCAQRPCLAIGGIVFNEPLGSFLVFLLAFLWIGVGITFLRNHRNQRSAVWLGVALVLGGIGAALAGTSYQAFSYMLKCAGREYCLLTNGLEVGYSLTQAISVSAMMTAVAYACATGRLRRALIFYAVVNALVYLGVSIAGAALPSRTLLSFEVLMLFALPGILAVILLSGWRLRRSRRAADRSLLFAAILLLVVQAAYFSYAAAGFTATLWNDGRGFYFSENDVLHIGMIAWLVYVRATLRSSLCDDEAR